MRALALAALALLGTTGAAPFTPQLVLDRYASHLLHAQEPKLLVFSYTISQAGVRNIEQTHRIFRSGDLVRDETLLLDGSKQKDIRIARYRNRYTLENLAPRLTQYAFVYEQTHRQGTSLQYAYRAVPLGLTGGFVVDSITIDGHTFLPSSINFHSGVAGTSGNGSITFGRAGKYWVPSSVSVEANIAGKPARERITFSVYQFPATLPKSTFQSPKPLPAPVLPAF